MSINLVGGYESDSDEQTIQPNEVKSAKRKIHIEMPEDDDEVPKQAKGIFAALPPPKQVQKPQKKPKLLPRQTSKNDKIAHAKNSVDKIGEESFFTFTQEETDSVQIYDSKISFSDNPKPAAPIHYYENVEYQNVEYDEQEQEQEEAFEVEGIRKLKGIHDHFNPAQVKLKEVNQSEQTKRSVFEIEMSKEVTRARQPTESSFNVCI
jgi:hypothetical protein